ncbi:MAG: efflux RND transporter permease subunit [candidate division KSB1 bacterium]|nr:efflux RND transporter permease subunit [candidate division KSB1 bacterium]MDZ7300680.1 efflux RND transporter permease subunit [candidate division KSB1 bacterium]MDZ7309816.1 efflux RND transporter permease subunit [candidate division KSB1 bacterium]
MFRWIVGKSLKFRYLVLAVAVGLMYFGIKQLQKMPVDVFPEFAPPMVEIQTISLGLSAEEVESLVTVPLENVLAGVPGMDVMRSKSVPDLSAIKMYFKPGTDLFLARQMVNERIITVAPTLPSWASPPIMLPPLSATSRMMKIGISSKTRSVIDLSMITYWTIRQRIMRVPGVANVAIWGERLQMLNVNVVPELMRKHKVTLEEVMEATADALDVGLFKFSEGHHIGSGGWIDTPNQRLQVRHTPPVVQKYDKVTPDALANVPLAVRNGKQLLLKDVAEVVIDHQPMVGDAIINDGPGLLLIVEKFPWGNTLRVSREVEKALEALRPGLPDVEIDSAIFRPATFIEMAIHNLTKALYIAAMLVIVILFAFLFEWRTALISCTAIPLSLMAAMMVLYFRGTTINTMVLAGLVIALGAVVDDAIVDVENIVRRLREARKEGRKTPFGRLILEASYEVRHAIIFSSLIEIAALVPVFVMEGLSGAFFKPLALSYAIAIGASMVVALTVTPAMSFILLRNVALEHRESPLTRWLQRNYEAFLSKIVRKPQAAYATVGVFALAGILIWPRLGQSLLPDFKERDFLMHWLTKPGTSWPEEARITIQASKELRSIPGVRNFGAHIGQALIMDEVVGVYFGENWISVDPKVDYDETRDKIQATVDGYPGVYRDVQTYLKERIREVLTGTSEAIVVRIFGHDLDILTQKATEVKEALSKIDGIIDLHISFQEKIPQIEVKVDLEKAHKYGLKPGDVRRAATTQVALEEAGDIHIANRTYDVNVWSIPAARRSLTDVKNLLIDTPDGGHVRLKEVADVRVAPTPNVVNRENLGRRMDVDANVRGRPLGAVYADVQAALAKIEFPHEYYPVLLGEYTERLAVQRKMLISAIIAGIAIFFLLHTSFKNARLAMLSFLLLPSALVGGVLAAWLGDGIISLGSIVGFLTVLGISARNGILMINHFQHLEDFEGEKFGPGLVVRGARERLAPILMTASTTGLALIPLVISGAIPGNEIEHPMAVVILGGLITSTLLNLFIVPSLYLKFGRRSNSAASAQLT